MAWRSVLPSVPLAACEASSRPRINRPEIEDKPASATFRIPALASVFLMAWLNAARSERSFSDTANPAGSTEALISRLPDATLDRLFCRPDWLRVMLLSSRLVIDGLKKSTITVLRE